MPKVSQWANLHVSLHFGRCLLDDLERQLCKLIVCVKYAAHAEGVQKACRTHTSTPFLAGFLRTVLAGLSSGSTLPDPLTPLARFTLLLFFCTRAPAHTSQHADTSTLMNRSQSRLSKSPAEVCSRTMQSRAASRAGQLLWQAALEEHYDFNVKLLLHLRLHVVDM